MGNATVTELFGLAGAIVVLAGLTVVVVNGGKFAKIVTASGNVFVRSIRVATQQ